MTNVSGVLRWFIRLYTSIAKNLSTEQSAIPVLMNPWDMTTFNSSRIDDMLELGEIAPFLLSILDPNHVTHVEHIDFKIGDGHSFQAIFFDKFSSLYNKVHFEVYADGLIVYHASGPSREKAISNFFSSADTNRFVSQMTREMFDRVINSRNKEERKAVSIIESTWLEHALRPGGVLAERAGRSFARLQNARNLIVTNLGLQTDKK